MQDAVKDCYMLKQHTKDTQTYINIKINVELIHILIYIYITLNKNGNKLSTPSA